MNDDQNYFILFSYHFDYLFVRTYRTIPTSFKRLTNSNVRQSEIFYRNTIYDEDS